ncbi:hypothetical protein NDU88_004320 [Pleurodeles waltl]|uniref:Uncharacterized protein n=1 Tax=Pleurodeles waltl TaxID=8319 RepID=A0AAV7L4D9_PLEWA|nr:hypothetical protein NDU88_004320 [Pleurodeles waltl]
MTSQRHTKKEGSLRDLFAKTPAKKVLPDKPQVMEDGETVTQRVQEGGDAPLTRPFMEQLFGTLLGDFATLKQEIVAEVKEMKQEVMELGQRIDTLEQAQDAREEESWRSNIRIKGVPSQAVTGKLENLVERLFRYVALDLKNQTVVLDRTQRIGRPACSPGTGQDILTCLHHYKQRETIMAVAWDQPLIDFEGFRVGLFQDLSTLTLQWRRMLRPVTDFRRENNIRYKWGHPSRLQFVWQNETRAVRTVEEAQALEGMLPRL